MTSESEFNLDFRETDDNTASGEEFLTELEAADVIEVRDDTIVISPEYVESVSERVTTLTAGDEQAAEEVIMDAIADRDITTALLEMSELDPEFVALYISLEETFPDLSPEDMTALSLSLLNLYETTTPPDDGVPEAFVPLQGNRLPLVVRLCERCIVYTWRHDCAPCEQMMNSFEDLLPSPPEDIVCVAVYGPGCAELLHEEFDVVGSPTTLFVRDGEVETRLVGAHHESAIKTEIDKVRGS